MTTCLHNHGLEFMTHQRARHVIHVGAEQPPRERTDLFGREVGRSKSKTGPAFESCKNRNLSIEQYN